MERLILRDLERWKESKRRKPLVLRGARQVGKTWVLEEFGRSILSAKGGEMTSYGAVSGRSQSLFTPISKGHDEDETEEIDDDESEDEEEGLEACLT